MTYYNANVTIVGIPAYSQVDAIAIVGAAVRNIGISHIVTAQPVAAMSPAQLALFERTA